MAEQPSALGSGALWAMLDNLAQQVLSFAVFLILARLIAPQEFGLIAVAHLVITFLRQTILDAIVHPVARCADPTDALYSYAFGLCVLVSALMCAAMLASAAVLARWYAQPDLVVVVSWMSLVILTTGMAAVYEARLIRQMQFRPLAIRSIVSVTIGGVVGIVLALRDAGVMALVAQQVVTGATALALLVVQSNWQPQWTKKRAHPHLLLADAVRVGFTGLFGFISSQGDTVLISVLMGPYATGIYSFAKRLTSAVYLVVGSSLLRLAIAAFARAQGDSHALRESYVRILGMSVCLMAPLLAGLSILASPLIAQFFGMAWMPAVPIVALLSVFYLFLAANQINDYLLFAVGARSIPMRRTLVQIVVALALGLLMFHKGLAWIAAGFVIAGVVVWPWAQWLANGHMQFGFLKLARALQAPALATAAMMAVLLFSQRYAVPTAFSLGVQIVCGAGVFLTIHWMVTAVSSGAHNALEDLTRLFVSQPVD
ncbi:MAG: hypothetical protein RL032_1776 [Pseudomonadota bacterium]